MINNISFKGMLIKASYMKPPSSYQEQEELADMKKYAKENDCDVFVARRTSYLNDEGVYDAVIAREDEKIKKVSFNYRTHQSTEIAKNTIHRLIQQD